MPTLEVLRTLAGRLEQRSENTRSFAKLFALFRDKTSTRNIANRQEKDDGAFQSVLKILKLLL